MTSFPTTGPIEATIEVELGDIWVVAGDDATHVDVAPSDPANERDRRAADAIRVTCADGRLRVVGPRNRLVGPTKRSGSVQVRVRLAPGSALAAVTGFGAITVEGRLGQCRAKTSMGDVRVQGATTAVLRTGMGALVAGDIAGEATCSTGAGVLQVDRIGGRAEVKNSNGDSWIGVSGGPLRVKAANGDIAVDRSVDDVTATTANGNLRVGRAEGGSVQLKTAMGRIEVGIPAGTAALLDLSTSFGTVRNGLDAASQPATGDRIVEIHAQTSAGDIEIVRVLEEVQP